MSASLLLLGMILWARLAPNHSRAVKAYLDIELIATAVLALVDRLVGWQSPLYTVVYDGFTALIFLAFASVIWESQRS